MIHKELSLAQLAGSVGVQAHQTNYESTFMPVTLMGKYTTY